MIITKTPFRISFFGGGTDFPSYYNEYGGKCLSTTIDKYAYVTVRHLPRFFDYNNEIVYSKIEQVKNEDEIVHPLVRNAMKILDMHELHIAYDADLPARTGLGTSSSFAVGLVNAFFALKGKEKDKKVLSDYAIFIERSMCKEAGGIQDQIAAAFGDINVITFNKNVKDYNKTTDAIYKKIDYIDYIDRKDYQVEKLWISGTRKQELNDNLLLYFTGISRNSFEVQVETEKSLKNKIEELKNMTELVDKAKQILTSDSDINEFGKMLDWTFKLKRGLNKNITNSYIDDIYDKAIKNGACGGKLLGAGGGGFLLFYVEKDKQEFFRSKMSDLMEVPFNFENKGTHILYNSPELDYIEE